jgi:hypothetical protein
VGRRDLTLGATLVAALALAAPAGASLHWSRLDNGIATGAQSSPTAFLALDRASAARFSARLPAKAAAVLNRIDFRRNAVVAVFGEFGCQDGRVSVTSVAQQGSRLIVSLAMRALPPGTMECMALFPTYRLLAVTKAGLTRPYPTRAEARLARA